MSLKEKKTRPLMTAFQQYGGFLVKTHKSEQNETKVHIKEVSDKEALLKPRFRCQRAIFMEIRHTPITLFDNLGNKGSHKAILFATDHNSS